MIIKANRTKPNIKSIDKPKIALPYAHYIAILVLFEKIFNQIKSCQLNEILSSFHSFSIKFFAFFVEVKWMTFSKCFCFAITCSGNQIFIRLFSSSYLIYFFEIFSVFSLKNLVTNRR